ncbi:hypothetical protein [Kitasatospora sp. NPDC088346]|uniref:hypothetical protein n=1 Tax=Kitasatospora sp. NPDC088346 TaxID=3364073 RepID=UPI003822E5BC
MFQLLPGVGVELPHGAGTLTFGADEPATATILARLGPGGPADAVPADCAWSRTARWGDVTVTARAGSTADGLHAVVLSRTPSAASRPGGTPVVLDDVDLLGYPVREVLAAVGSAAAPGLRIRPAHGDGYAVSVALHAGPPPTPEGRRSRAAARAAEVGAALAGYEPLWTTERDRWQLQATGDGHLPVRRGDPGTTLLICHDDLARRVAEAMLAAGVEVLPERS